MSEMVLVATPARRNTPRVLLDRIEELVHGLTYPMVEWRLHLNEQPATGGKYVPNALARNEVADRYVKDYHDWVLWLDADIIEAPADLIEQLMAISMEYNRAITAPMVWTERVKDGPVSIENGGWFYDTGGFIGLDGKQADFYTGPAGPGRIVPQRSVGCVYLVPGRLYRQGLRYQPRGNEVEHRSFCEQARAAGTAVLACRDISVRHAYLPKYGEAWHSS